jgi:hypothetical protein
MNTDAQIETDAQMWPSCVNGYPQLVDVPAVLVVLPSGTAPVRNTSVAPSGVYPPNHYRPLRRRGRGALDESRRGWYHISGYGPLVTWAGISILDVHVPSSCRTSDTRKKCGLASARDTC